jgi:hypothetical protein
MNAKSYKVEYKISEDSQTKTSIAVTIKQAIELQLYCEAKNYSFVRIIKIK